MEMNHPPVKKTFDYGRNIDRFEVYVIAEADLSGK